MNDFLRAFVDNKEIFEAVKAEVLKEFDLFDVDVDVFLNNNLQLGEVVRARVQGKELVKDAFRKMESYRTPVKEVDEVNPGR